jgi:hypothetical protein
VILNGVVPVTDHLNGKSHFKKKQLQDKKIIFDDNIEIYNNKYYCKICNISCSGAIPMQTHINGVLHFKNLKVYED